MASRACRATTPAFRAQAPPLGPPLPGDLGRPILNAGAAPSTVVPTAPAVDPEAAAPRAGDRSRATQPAVRLDEYPRAADADRCRAGRRRARRARRRTADATLDRRRRPRRTCRIASSPSSTPRSIAAPSAPIGSQRRHRPMSCRPAPSFPAALITGIRSDLPGQITAQVTENVYDSPTGRFLLIPQGAQLIGSYDSQVAFGQSRVLLVWTRLIMPNGKSIVLERQPGADTAGLCRARGRGRQSLGHAVQGRGPLDPARRRRRSSARTATRAISSRRCAAARRRASTRPASRSCGRNLNIQPTLTIRPGFPVRVIVNRDLVLAPYGQEANRWPSSSSARSPTTSRSS